MAADVCSEGLNLLPLAGVKVLPTNVTFRKTGVIQPFRLRSQNEDNGILDVIETDRPVASPEVWFYPPNRWKHFRWKTQKTVGKGLYNSQQICFLNATTQALAYCPPFAEDCFIHRHGRTCIKRTVGEMCAYCLFENQICNLFRRQELQPNEAVHKQSSLKNNFKKLSGWGYFLKLASRKIAMGGNRGWLGEEQCAHEWLTQWVEWLTECDLPSNEAMYLFKRSKLRRVDLQTTYLQQLFTLELAEYKVCSDCKATSTQYETHVCLRASSQAKCLSNGVASFFVDETMGGGNAPHCYRCGIARVKISRRQIIRPPNVLCVMVQRALSGGFMKFAKKSSEPLQIPEVLDLSPHVAAESSAVTEQASSPGSHNYHLCSAVSHIGTLHSGHYWAVVKGPDGLWYLLDDDRVKLVSPKEAFASMARAYLVFYTREKPLDMAAHYGFSLEEATALLVPTGQSATADVSPLPDAARFSVTKPLLPLFGEKTTSPLPLFGERNTSPVFGMSNSTVNNVHSAVEFSRGEVNSTKLEDSSAKKKRKLLHSLPITKLSLISERSNMVESSDCTTPKRIETTFLETSPVKDVENKSVKGLRFRHLTKPSEMKFKPDERILASRSTFTQYPSMTRGEDRKLYEDTDERKCPASLNWSHFFAVCTWDQSDANVPSMVAPIKHNGNDSCNSCRDDSRSGTSSGIKQTASDGSALLELDDGEILKRRQQFRSIQEMLLPKSSARDEHDKKLDLGKQKKVKNKAKLRRRHSVFKKNLFAKRADAITSSAKQHSK